MVNGYISGLKFTKTTHMGYAGLVIELLFLAFGIYIYLLSRGFVKFGNAETRKRTEEFLTNNASWMRLLALALIAVMSLNVFLHLRDLLAH